MIRPLLENEGRPPGPPKSAEQMLRDTLDRLDADLSTLSPGDQQEFLDALAAGLEDRLLALIEAEAPES